MIDIENFEEGTEVWCVHNNKPREFIGLEIIEYSTASGSQFNVLGVEFDVPADHCYLSKKELIGAQINYWREMGLNEIVKENW